MVEWMCLICDLAWRQMTDEWRKVIIVKSRKYECNNYRGISLCSVGES